jgi:hypothetical protein
LKDQIGELQAEIARLRAAPDSDSVIACHPSLNSQNSRTGNVISERAHNQSTGADTSATAVARAVARFPKLDIFTGDDADEDFLRWLSTTKDMMFLHQAAFDSERAKILWVKRFIKGRAYDVIAERAEMDSPNPYASLADMYNDLNDIFRNRTIEFEALAMISSPNFRQKDSERFRDFYIRFTRTVSPVHFSDSMKSLYLRINLNRRLHEAMCYLDKDVSFNERVESLLEQDAKIMEHDRLFPPMTRTAASTKKKTTAKET